jgi:hypothetical protein
MTIYFLLPYIVGTQMTAKGTRASHLLVFEWLGGWYSHSKKKPTTVFAFGRQQSCPPKAMKAIVQLLLLQWEDSEKEGGDRGKVQKLFTSLPSKKHSTDGNI